MRNGLPTTPRPVECAVINLDDVDGPGTHWTAYAKRGVQVKYFDSFGDLPPPQELKHYLRGCKILYNYQRYQRPSSVNCGHLCLKFLCEQCL